MNTIAFDELKENPDEIIERLCQSEAPCLITREDNRNLVVISQKAYDSAMRNISGAELTMKEIESRYADQWVLIKVTALDEYGNPAKGVVVTHSDERDALTAPVMQMHGEDTRAKSYIFFTGNVMPENVTVLL